jgi:hypothetical protein
MRWWHGVHAAIFPGKCGRSVCRPAADQGGHGQPGGTFLQCRHLASIRACRDVYRVRFNAMPQYLLPCTCGQRVTVTTAQAGSRVRCGCGRMLDVPTLRGLSRLEVARAGREVAGGRAWGPVRGGLFAGGLLVAAVGLVLIVLYGVRSVQLASLAVDRSAEVVSGESAYIDQRTPAELLDLWNAEREEGLGESRMPIWVAAQQRRRTFHIWMAVGAAGVALGAATAAAASLSQRRTGAASTSP